jgi:hypothetical protein
MKRTNKAGGIIAGLAALLVAVVFGFWAGCENLGYEDAAMTDIEDTKAAVYVDDQHDNWEIDDDDGWTEDDDGDDGLFHGVQVNTITLNKTSLMLTKGGEEQLTVTVDPVLPEGAAVTWISQKPGVVSVSEDGTVKALKNGSAKIAAKAGGKKAICTVDVPFVPGLYIGEEGNISQLEGDVTLAGAFAWIKTNGVDNGTYRIVLGADETENTTNGYRIGRNNSYSTGLKASLTIILQGTSNGITISKSTMGYLFQINSANATDVPHLILENITLTLDSAVTNNWASLINLGTRGKLTMRTGSRITGNTVYNGSGGGVTVNINSTFTMEDGKIDGNKLVDSYEIGYGRNGGGVYCRGTFIMSGGSIENNEAEHNGGGVYLAGGSFTMSGNARILNNRAANGGGVGLGDSSSVISNVLFEMKGGVIAGNIAKTKGAAVFYRISGSSSDSIFQKTGGVIYGNAETGDYAPYANTVDEESGHVIEITNHSSNVTQRWYDSTAGETVNLDSSTTENWGE